MLDPETIALIESSAYGLAQNLIASAIVEWKKLKDDREAQENAAWLEDHEHAKALIDRISQKTALALRQSNLSREHFNLLLPLAQDAVLSSELTKQIIADNYSAESFTKLMLKHDALAAASEAQVKPIAGLLITLIQSAIAEDAHLCRVKQLQFQARTTEDISDIHKAIAAGFTKNQDAVRQIPLDIETVVQRAVKSALAEGSREAEHLKSQNQKRFDRAREALVHGSVVTAEREYRALVSDLENIGTLFDERLLFRSYTNLGSSLWQQSKRDEAVVWFDKAYVLKSDEQLAKTNKAAAHIHRKEFLAALGILSELQLAKPNCFEAHYLTSFVHLEQGDTACAIAVLLAHPFETDNYFEALAQAYLIAEDFPQSARAARLALAKNANSSEAMVTLACSLGFSLVHRKMNRELSAFSLTEAEYRQIRDAIEVAESAVVRLRSQDRYFQLGELLTNLCAFYELVHDDEAAAQSAKEAVAIAPLNATSLTNHWASQMRLGKYACAYEAAGKLIQLGEKLAGKLRQLESLVCNTEHQRMLQEAESDAELAVELSNVPRFYELKAQAQFALHQTTDAFDTIQQGFKRFPDDARLHCARAFLHDAIGQRDAAREDLEHAEQSGAGDAPRAILQAALFYYHHNDWSSAAQRFAKLGADSIHSPFLDNYLVCLHNLGQFPECFALAVEAIVAKSSFNATLHELAARCAYNADNLPSAQKHFETLVHHNTAKAVEHQKMLAQVYLRLDEPTKALALLKKAQARTPNDTDVLIGLSFASALGKNNKDAVGFAFEAVNSAPNDPRAHLALVKAVLDSPPEVKVDANQRKGFQRTLKFLQKHPSGFIKAVPIEKDFKSIIAMVKARAERAHKIEDLVREKSLPMSVFAQQLGLPPFHAWLGLVGHTQLRFQMAYGTSVEQAKEVKTALAGKAVCADVFALFTLRLLNCLDLLPKLCARLFAHTATLEAIVDNIREMEASKPGMSISYHEGKLLRYEPRPEQIIQQLSFLRDIRDFLKSSAVELVGLDAAFVSTEELKTARNLLGAIYYDPLLVSKSRGLTYYTDDAPMRALGANSHGVESFCTQALLRAAKENNLLSNAQYEDAIITLLRHNYYFVSESVETLARLVESEGFQPSELAKTMLGRVADPKVDQSTAIRILSDFCFFIWRADLSNAKTPREEWVELCLDSILKVKQPEKLFAQFLGNLGVRALTQPAIFGGITHWILLSNKLSKFQRMILSVAIQEGVLQMTLLAKREYVWWTALHEEWRWVRRWNRVLHRNGWL